MNQEQFTELASSYIFKGMAIKEVQYLLSLFKQVKVTEGKTIFVENMPGESLYLVQQGTIQISQLLAEIDEQNLTTITAGNVFGELAIIDGGTRYATSRAIKDSILQVLKRDDFNQLVREKPRLGLQLTLNIVRLFSAKMRSSKKEYRTMLVASLNRKV